MAKAKTKTEKLPVPPPTAEQASASAALKHAEALTGVAEGITSSFPAASDPGPIPATLDRTKGKQLSGKELTKAVRKAVDKTAMPLEGKAALRAIANASKHPVRKIPNNKSGLKAAAGKKAANEPKQNGNGKAKVVKAKAVKRGAPKTDILVEMVCRKNGATHPELCKAIGWAKCLPAMQKACKQAGVKVKSVKEKGELTHYVGTKR